MSGCEVNTLEDQYINYILIFLLSIPIIVEVISCIISQARIKKTVLGKSDRVDKFRFEDKGFVYKIKESENKYIDVPNKPFDFKKELRYEIGAAVSDDTVFTDRYITGVKKLRMIIDAAHYCDIEMFLNKVNTKYDEYQLAEISIKSGLYTEVIIDKLKPSEKYYFKVYGPAYFLGYIEPIFEDEITK